MEDLKKQEQFEMEVLERLNSARLLDGLVFCGGTMLRLCYELPRYSVDLDFWLADASAAQGLYADMERVLAQKYEFTDRMNKKFTLLFELRSPDYPRRLKIEVRKDPGDMRTESAIAFSTSSNVQVAVKTLALDEMMQSKVDALIDRKETRDAFDIEFLLRRGIPLEIDQARLKKLSAVVNGFTKAEIVSKLGSLLAPDVRR
ncbi:MAG TPA: nucleotidyl transferase AbiEii/AbiGii toxin family protein, partial [Candidatus Bathyarchaeia archaeon]|nr:nucleotidyl transferase AbiEii/AbiGii toxin family protein [Candidatus Bathyarchaeia archaeon]